MNCSHVDARGLFACASKILQVACLTLFSSIGLSEDELLPSNKFWYSVDGNHWKDAELHSVQLVVHQKPEPNEYFATLRFAADGSRRTVPFASLSPPDIEYLRSVTSRVKAIHQLQDCMFSGARKEEETKWLDFTRGEWARGASDNYWYVQKINLAKPPRNYAGERYEHVDGRMHVSTLAHRPWPDLQYTDEVWNVDRIEANGTQFEINSIKFSLENAGIDELDVSGFPSDAVFWTNNRKSVVIHLVPTYWPRYQYTKGVYEQTELSHFIPRSPPTGSPIRPRLQLVPYGDQWVTPDVAVARDEAERAEQQWSLSQELELPFAQRRLVITGDRLVTKGDLETALQAYVMAQEKQIAMAALGKAPLHNAHVNIRIAHVAYALSEKPAQLSAIEWPEYLSAAGEPRTKFPQMTDGDALNHARLDLAFKNIEDSRSMKPMLSAVDELSAWILASQGLRLDNDYSAHDKFELAMKRLSVERITYSAETPSTVADFLMSKREEPYDPKTLALNDMFRRCETRLDIASATILSKWRAEVTLEDNSKELEALNGLLTSIDKLALEQEDVLQPRKQVSLHLKCLIADSVDGRMEAAAKTGQTPNVQMDAIELSLSAAEEAKRKYDSAIASVKDLPADLVTMGRRIRLPNAVKLLSLNETTEQLKSSLEEHAAIGMKKRVEKNEATTLEGFDRTRASIVNLPRGANIPMTPSWSGWSDQDFKAKIDTIDDAKLFLDNTLLAYTGLRTTLVGFQAGYVEEGKLQIPIASVSESDKTVFRMEVTELSRNYSDRYSLFSLENGNVRNTLEYTARYILEKAESRQLATRETGSESGDE